jgi:hypothetical protein
MLMVPKHYHSKTDKLKQYINFTSLLVDNKEEETFKQLK